ncbi:MAG: M23 family metallopeptidase [Thermoleophilaceae bacterium]
MRPTSLAATVLILACCLAGAPPAGASPPWRWPVAGPVITPYTNGSDPYAGGQHRGIDVAAPVGAPVVAAAAGVVTFAGVAGSSGLTVAVTTDDGFDTSYLHLSSLAVRRGDRVEPGAPIGRVGTTGRRSAAEPHLHFGVREAGSRFAYRDPLDFLPVAPPAATPRSPAPVPVGVPMRPRVESGAIPVRARPLAGSAPVAATVPLSAALPFGLPAPVAPSAPASPPLAAAAAPHARLAGHAVAPTAPSPAALPGGPSRASAPGRLAAGALAKHSVVGAGARDGGPARHPASRRAASAAGPRHVAATRLGAPRPSAGPSNARASLMARPPLPVRAEHPGGRGRSAIDVGWLAACLAMVAAATILGRPRAATRSLRRALDVRVAQADRS